MHCAWAVAPGAPKSEPRPQNGCRQSSLLWGEARGGLQKDRGWAGLGWGEDCFGASDARWACSPGLGTLPLGSLLIP